MRGTDQVKKFISGYGNSDMGWLPSIKFYRGGPKCMFAVQEFSVP